MTDYSGESYTRLTDKSNVIGIEASDYNDERVNHVTAVSPSYLQDALEILNILSWDEIDVMTVEDDRAGNPMLVFTPSSSEFGSDNQAGIAIAPKRDKNNDE